MLIVQIQTIKYLHFKDLVLYGHGGDADQNFRVSLGYKQQDAINIGSCNITCIKLIEAIDITISIISITMRCNTY